ncbi:MAG TPA: glycosyltransferase, partial [Solirubrobacteraceae bacterium]|nr:glycosyltransferase [Solirubrobacteraceae bacterium]
EAMACGCPVASSLAASLEEVVGDAVEILVPTEPEQIARAIERVAFDDELRETLRERGFAQAARFSWAEAADRHLAVYRRAAATIGPV